MANTKSHGIISDIIELAIMTPDYDDAKRHEHHSRVRDFLLDLKAVVYAVANVENERRKAHKEERFAARPSTENI